MSVSHRGAMAPRWDTLALAARGELKAAWPVARRARERALLALRRTHGADADRAACVELGHARAEAAAAALAHSEL